MPELFVSRWAIVSAGLSVALCSAASAYEFEDFQRWSRTATDGSGLGQGDPTTLTWSFVPDGTTTTTNTGSPTTSGPSDLIAFLDDLRGDNGGGSDLTQRPWFEIFEDSYARLGEVSGLTFVYEDDDDGVSQATSNRGILNTRGDIRIAGRSIDGQSGSNTLAFNSFPNNGEMVIDTDNTTFYGGTSNNNRAFRNVIMHEVGHGLGIEHLESNNASFLLEPFISTSFDGPQFDDILALHRGYGDFNEKSNNGAGNDTAGNATALGALSLNTTKSIGTDADDTFVSSVDTDFVSIDDNSDTDYYSFSLSIGAVLDLVLTPMGPTYNTAPQTDPATTQTPYDSSALSDLALALFDTNGSSLLASSSAGGLGDSESILGFTLTDPGTYFVRVTGDQDFAQFYQLDLLATALPFVLGDLNGDLLVDENDLAIILGNFGAAVTGGSLADGDATGDGLVNASDLDIIVSNWTGSSPPSAVIPEPGTLAMVAGLIGLAIRRRRAA